MIETSLSYIEFSITCLPTSLSALLVVFSREVLYNDRNIEERYFPSFNA